MQDERSGIERRSWAVSEVHSGLLPRVLFRCELDISRSLP